LSCLVCACLALPCLCCAVAGRGRGRHQPERPLSRGFRVASHHLICVSTTTEPRHRHHNPDGQRRRGVPYHCSAGATDRQTTKRIRSFARCDLRLKMRSFYQDRLGTHTGKALKKRDAFSCCSRSSSRKSAATVRRQTNDIVVFCFIFQLFRCSLLRVPSLSGQTVCLFPLFQVYSYP
jgi:hypothetical protein